MRHASLALLTIIVLAACAKHEPAADRQEPAPVGIVSLRPDAVETTSVVQVPGAPEACVANFFVRAPRSACPTHAEPLKDVIRGVVADSAAGATCHLSCWDTDDYATWALFVPVRGLRGELTCDVEGAGHMTFVVVDPAAGFSASVGADWLTGFEGAGYAWDMRTDTHYITRNACPAGQPVRPTGS